MAHQATGLRAQRALPGLAISPIGAIGVAAAVTAYFPTDRRRRSSKPVCDPPHRPAGGNAARDLLALRKSQRSRSSPPWRRSNAAVESQHTINAALVPSLKCAGNVRHTLTVLPSLPELCPLPWRKPYPCILLHRSPPNPTRLEGVASTG